MTKFQKCNPLVENMGISCFVHKTEQMSSGMGMEHREKHKSVTTNIT